MTWRPATEAEVSEILEHDLSVCTDTERQFFERIRVVPFRRDRIARGDAIEHVFTVAAWRDVIVFWEDVEEGFEVARVDSDGVIRQYGASKLASVSGRVAPAAQRLSVRRTEGAM
jgi:hypothetical protein